MLALPWSRRLGQRPLNLQSIPSIPSLSSSIPSFCINQSQSGADKRARKPNPKLHSPSTPWLRSWLIGRRTSSKIIRQVPQETGDTTSPPASVPSPCLLLPSRHPSPSPHAASIFHFRHQALRRCPAPSLRALLHQQPSANPPSVSPLSDICDSFKGSLPVVSVQRCPDTRVEKALDGLSEYDLNLDIRTQLRFDVVYPKSAPEERALEVTASTILTPIHLRNNNGTTLAIKVERPSIMPEQRNTSSTRCCSLEHALLESTTKIAGGRAFRGEC
ncbi:hypothetical protein B0T21DRAFT_172076 [Apiosordaria backusii]|uniref:Uncharacterized protein n=1 Tax=Apiosordaria backusii TaxID=314023 RepID=A0AA40BKM1_9PEZI|nr:hypothetical protein B0T21DRAFT_172076 [Apiosordaria backusii]